MLFLQPLQAVAGGATCRSFRASVVRPVGPLAQRVSVIQPGGPDRCPGPYPVGAACHTLRRFLRFGVEAMCLCSGTVPVSGDRYLPHQRRCVAHAGRAVPARALEAVCLPHGASVFVGVREPKVSRPWSRQSPTPTGLRCQTASKAIPSAALRGLVGLETLALGPAASSSIIPTTSPAPVTRPRDSKPTRSTRNPRSGGSAYGRGVPRSGDGN